MNPHVRAVSYLWAIVAVALAAWSLLGLATDEHSRSVITSWLIALGFSVLALAAGLTFGRTDLLGRVLVRVVSVLALLYSAAWLLLGGVEDAGGYWPAIIFAVALAIYTLVAARSTARAA